MAIGLATAIRTSQMTDIKTAIDAGAGAGLIKIYNGTQPATGGAATTLLATLTCSDPCGTVTNGVLTFSAITADSSADATSTATWARIVDSDLNFVMDCTVGTSGTDIILNTAAIVTGAAVSITSAVLTAGNA